MEIPELFHGTTFYPKSFSGRTESQISWFEIEMGLHGKHLYITIQTYTTGNIARTVLTASVLMPVKANVWIRPAVQAAELIYDYHPC